VFTGASTPSRSASGAPNGRSTGVAPSVRIIAFAVARLERADPQAAIVGRPHEWPPDAEGPAQWTRDDSDAGEGRVGAGSAASAS
jgi:hypothetical protein